MNPHRLYRSRNERMIAGVAGGMAEYLDVDPTVIRILWILATFLGGITILLYPIMAIIVPLAPYGAPAPYGTPSGVPGTGDAPADGWVYQPVAPVEHRGPGASVYVGALFILVGLFALGDTIFPGWSLHASAGPLIVVAFGAMLLFSAFRRPAVR